MKLFQAHVSVILSIDISLICRFLRYFCLKLHTDVFKEQRANEDEY